MLLRISQMISQDRQKLNKMHQSSNMPLMGCSMKVYPSYNKYEKIYLMKHIIIARYMVT
jgi:hypothetical protein